MKILKAKTKGDFRFKAVFVASGGVLTYSSFLGTMLFSYFCTL